MSDDINKKSFSRMVETYVFKNKGCTYMDAVIELCEKNEIDLRDAKKLINKQIVEHIEREARDINMIAGGTNTYVLPV